MKNVHSKLCSLGPWLWQRRKWGIALAAAVMAGIMVFDPTVRFYIYEHVRPRSPLLPRPGEKWSFTDENNEYEYVFTTRFLYEDLSDCLAAPPMTDGLMLPRYEDTSRELMGMIEAIISIEIVDYIVATMDAIPKKPLVKESRVWPKRYTLAVCKINKILAQRKDVVNLKEGDEIVLLMIASPGYLKSENLNPLFEQGHSAQMIHCLISSDFIKKGFEQINITPFYACVNEGKLYSPVIQDNYDFTCFETLFYLPEYEKEYGPIGTWDVDTFSHNLQEYFDLTEYEP